MKLLAEEIRNLTFPSSAMGYKKKDVDDFLVKVAKDYDDFQRKLDQSKHETKAAEEEKQELLKKQLEQRAADVKRSVDLEQENERLKRQIDDLLTTSVSENLNEEASLTLAQKIALRIEQEAKEEAQLIKNEADHYYKDQLKKIQNKQNEFNREVSKGLNRLISSERMVIASIDTIKSEYVRIMDEIRKNYETFIEESKTK